YEPLSAGTRPVSSINPLAIEVMREVGIDISKQKSKILTEDMIRKSILRVNMGCVEKESCPTLFIHKVGPNIAFICLATNGRRICYSEVHFMEQWTVNDN
ncbi:MAG: hypothetical protein WAJ93_26635, partial [Candidatus Nitrosopolaris sp.]